MPNNDDIGRPSVHDLWRLALPSGTRLVNTQGDVRRPVAWARRMSSHIPAFTALEENEIVLLSVDAIPQLDDRLTLAKIVTSLTERNIPAIAAVGNISEQAKQAADEHHICILALPDGTDLRDVERDIVRLIVEREAQIDRRGRQIYRQLAQLSIENRGLEAIAEKLHQIIGKSVIIQDEHLVVQAQAMTTNCPFASESLAQRLADRLALERWLHGQPLDGTAPPRTQLDLGEHDWVRCVAAIVTEGQLAGFLSILGPRDDLDDLDRLAAERGSLVCAVEMAKQRAVVAVEQRLQGDFVDMLLTAGPMEEPALIRRAAEMHYRLDHQHAVMLLDLTQRTPRGWSVAASELRTGLLHTGIQTLLCTYEDQLVVLCSAQNEATLKNLAEHAQTTRERITTLVTETHVSIGIGRIGTGLIGLRRSFGQAREALSLAHDLFNGDKILAFGDLALYHLLRRLQGCEELAEFRRQTLDPLSDYDAQHDTELVVTLEAFFKHNGNVSQTAEGLHVHRNSLLYRLERIADITGMDLDDADDRFALQFALKLRPLLN